MVPGQTLEMTVTDLAFGGAGVGRGPDGRAVFVPFVVVGDEATVRITAVHQRFARADVVGLRVPGPGRTVPPCPLYGRCGGCQYQHLTDALQAETKLRQLRSVLARLGGLPDIPAPDPVVRSPQAYGYRNKLKLEPVPGVGVGDASGARGVRYGFCALDNTTFLEVTACPLASARLNALIPEAQQSGWARRNAGSTRPGPLTLRETADGTTYFFFGAASHRQPWLSEQFLHREVRVPLGSFWQVNPGVADRLAATVRDWVAEAPPTLLIDAYAGVGTFSLAAGAGVRRRVLIETDAEALRAAEWNHRAWGLGECERVHGAAERVLESCLGSAGAKSADVTLVLDPPRTGCAERVLATIVRSTVARVLYVACDAACLARDLNVLVARGGFRLARLGFFDMFPQTAHFETLALLVRNTAG
jgi:tRNA/tmRNA/rRNA uracil-C5-methylase (TrmA/RlmC/RlmD family)